jgi:hypothetical protein
VTVVCLHGNPTWSYLWSRLLRELDIHRTTLRRWLKEEIKIPGHQHQVIRLLLGDLPGTAGQWSGWRFDPRRPGRGCPLVIYAVQRMPTLVWTLRLVPDAAGGEAVPHRDGQLRVAADTGQLGAMTATLRPDTDSLNIPALGEPDEDGGWYCRGRGTLTMQGDSLVGLMVYGMASGVRVAWWAASQVPQEQAT